MSLAATGPAKPWARARWGWKGLALAVALGALWLIAGLSAVTPSTPARSSPAETAHCIRDPRCHRTFVVAHRAEGFGAPENSRAAVGLVVEAGVPVVEIDLRASRDGRLFVMHDGWLERSTSLRGRVEEVSSEEIGRARLKNGESIPRFEDIYAITRGRAMLSVDFKVPERMMAEVAHWIHAHGSFDDLIFFANTGEEMAAAARAKQRYPPMIVMVRLLDTRVTVASTRQMILNRGQLDGVRLLSRKTVELMTTDQLGGIRFRPGQGFGLGFDVRTGGGAGALGSIGEFSWAGLGGTYFWIDPKEELIAMWMAQGPGQREYYRRVFKSLVLQAIVD